MSASNNLLLVEDEPAIQHLLEEALVDAGFEVAVAGNGARALAILGDDAAHFRIVITDIRLGDGPDGWAVGRFARERVPDMPIIYVSGDSAHEWSAKGVPNSVLVSKPFIVAQIITAVANLLNAADECRAGHKEG